MARIPRQGHGICRDTSLRQEPSCLSVPAVSSSKQFRILKGPRQWLDDVKELRSVFYL